MSDETRSDPTADPTYWERLAKKRGQTLATREDELRAVKGRLKQTRDIMVGLHDALLGVCMAIPEEPPRITQAFMDGAARLRRDELPPVILGLDGRPVRRGDS